MSTQSIKSSLDGRFIYNYLDGALEVIIFNSPLYREDDLFYIVQEENNPYIQLSVPKRTTAGVDINGTLYFYEDIGIQLQELVAKSLKSSDNTGGVDFGDLVYVNDISDLPAPVGNVITTESKLYLVTGDLDLNGAVLRLEGSPTFQGIGNEKSSIRSTGAPSGSAIFTADDGFKFAEITLSTDNQAGVRLFDVDPSRGNNQRAGARFFDTTISNTSNMGAIVNLQLGNFFVDALSIFNSLNLTIDQGFASIAGSSCAFIYTIPGVTGSMIILPATAASSRRVRFTDSVSNTVDGVTVLDIDFNMSFPRNETLVLDKINATHTTTPGWTGANGGFLKGLDEKSPISLFTGCVGFNNTSIGGEAFVFYEIGNGPITNVAQSGTFYPVAALLDDPNQTAGVVLYKGDELRLFRLIDHSAGAGSGTAIECLNQDAQVYDITVVASLSANNNAQVSVIASANLDGAGFVQQGSSLIRTTTSGTGRVQGQSTDFNISMKQGDILEFNATKNSTGNIQWEAFKVLIKPI